MTDDLIPINLIGEYFYLQPSLIVALELFIQFNSPTKYTVDAVVNRFKVRVDTGRPIPAVVETIDTSTQCTFLGLEVPRTSIHV